MFLLVSGRHVGAHLGGHQHGVSIQISIILGKTFLRISSIRKIAVTWILARVFAYLPSFYFQILGLIYWTVLIFYFDLFWMAWHWKPAIGPFLQLLIRCTIVAQIDFFVDSNAFKIKLYTCDRVEMILKRVVQGVSSTVHAQKKIENQNRPID